MTDHLDEVSWDPSHTQPVAHPITAAAVYGHEAILADVLEAWQRNRLPHAVMLTGPRGIGKATTAYTIARFLLHQGASSEAEAGLFDPAPQPDTLLTSLDSPTVRRMIAGSHTDFLTVTRSVDAKTKKLRKEIGVDDVRAMTTLMRQTPGEGAWRVVVIDAADDMNRNAENAMLKMLEEPPAQTVIILVVHRPGRLLPTVRSRCQKFTLHPLSDDNMRQVLGSALDTVDGDRQAVVFQLAAGSPGRVLMYLDAVAQTVIAQFLEQALSISHLNIPKAYAYADMIAKSEQAMKVYQDMVRWWLHRLAHFYGHSQPMGPEVYPGEISLLTDLKATVPLDQWLAVWDKANQLFDRAERINLDPRQVVMSVLTDMAKTAAL